jgi:hypothetical protein
MRRTEKIGTMMMREKQLKGCEGGREKGQENLMRNREEMKTRDRERKRQRENTGPRRTRHNVQDRTVIITGIR